MYVYIYEYMYIYIYIYIYMYIYTYTHTHTSTHTVSHLYPQQHQGGHRGYPELSAPYHCYNRTLLRTASRRK